MGTHGRLYFRAQNLDSIVCIQACNFSRGVLLTIPCVTEKEKRLVVGKECALDKDGRPVINRNGHPVFKELALAEIATAFSSLASELPHDRRQFVIYSDNLFNNINLLMHLRNHYGIAACGTTRHTYARYPKDQKKLQKEGVLPFGLTTSTEVDGVHSIVWQDRNLVRFLTTAHSPAATKSVKRKRPNGYSKTPAYRAEIGRIWGDKVEKVLEHPQVAVDYNTYMGGVDIADQYRSSYELQLRSLRTWFPLFFLAVRDCRHKQLHSLQKDHVLRLLPWQEAPHT